jgi:hypothetical protein
VRRFLVAVRDENDGQREWLFASAKVSDFWTSDRRLAMRLDAHAAITLCCHLNCGAQASDRYIVEV